MIPGTSVFVTLPCRRAIRCTTRSVYVSSSFVPKTTWRTTLTADATSAASSAHQKLETLIAPGATSDGEDEHGRVDREDEHEAEERPSTAGAARRRSGGRTALRTAIRSAAMTAPPKPFTSTPGTMQRSDEQGCRREQPGEDELQGLESGAGGRPGHALAERGMPAIACVDAT